MFNKSMEVESLASRIRERIDAYYPDLSMYSVKIKGRRWGGKGTAKTFRFEINFGDNGFRKVMFVKFSPFNSDNNMGRLEYEALSFLYPKMSLVEQHYNVPRPIDFYDDINALLIEEVEGLCFRDYLLRANSFLSSEASISQLCTTVFNCGKWLELFHTLTREDKKTLFSVNEFSSSFVKELESLNRSGFNQRTVNSVRQLMNNLESLGKVFSAPLAMWHYDFTPGHVFVNNDNISVIDIYGTRGISIYEDIGHWLASMSVVNNLPRHPFFNFYAANGVLGEKFLDGYFTNGDIKRVESFLLAYLYKLKYLIITFHEQYTMISDAIHPLAAKLYSKLRLTRLFEKHIDETCQVAMKIFHGLGTRNCA